jgi:hypothetical protein
VSPILEEDTGHTAKASRREASLLGIRPVRRPIRCPESNALDHLGRHGKQQVCADRRYGSIEEQVHHFGNPVVAESC